MGTETWYARSAHGGYPIIFHFTPEGYRKHVELILQPEEPNITFTRTTDLLKHLTGSTGHWSIDQYLRRGRYQKPNRWVGEPQVSTLDLFQPVIVGDVEQGPLIQGSNQVTVMPGGLARNLATEIILEHGPGLVGIDLINRADEVMKILFAGYGGWIRKSKFDPTEVLQEVYKGMLVRNQGKCPWDRSKSSFGHYVHMVCGSVLSNYHRKQMKIRRWEQVGIVGYTPEGDRALIDVASTNIPTPPTADEKDHELLNAITALKTHLTKQTRPKGVPLRMAKAMIPHLLRGDTRAQMAEALGVTIPHLKPVLSWLRTASRTWFNPVTV